MDIVTSPDSWEHTMEPRIFLAGGITGCPDWQTQAAYLFSDLSCTVLNPRRLEFDVNDPNAAPAQIEWEHHALRSADAIMFWFARETVQPITLYELGAWSMADTPLFVGVHPDYPRRLDVEIQTRLVRPEVTVWSTLELVVEEVHDWYHDSTGL